MAVGLFSSIPASNRAVSAGEAPSRWTMGKPIVTYWAGPMPMTEAAAQQMAEGGWNLIWCREPELEVVQHQGLRGVLHDGLLTSATLDTAEGRAKLDALIERVRKHPAFYCYFLGDEPTASAFPALGKLVAYLRERDPEHLAYLNLFPTYANNEQLGTPGDTVTAYKEHLRQYVEVVRPALISYDHYHFTTNGDGGQYFLNLGMIRQAALDAGVPFLNIVQACSWTPSMRIPNGDELRWLVYTSLAYGAQGLSYYVYSHPNHNGAMATLEGQPTELYQAAKTLNREFASIAAALQPLRSLGAYHVGMIPPGADSLPEAILFRLDPPLAAVDYAPSKPVQGFALGCFGPPASQGDGSGATHLLLVNLDYKQEQTTTVVGPMPWESFDPATGKWIAAGGKRVELRLSPGGGKLLRAGG
ncbi:MAG: hypothetical protein COZ06_17365 [Armatimonadetes bacterium CG_4_10_14_3_um_filter_66_18]|nr:MAG: hypothetical protein COZ06_17365 [Armatimonadetes bacterium CG_4_10_14_3_um_filter_66_18]